MKNQQYLKYTFIIILMIATSCKKNIDLTPEGFLPTTYTSEVQLVSQLAGTYNALQNDNMYGQGLWGYLEAGADECFRSGVLASTVITEEYNINANETNISLFWRSCYYTIERANILISQAPTISMDVSKRNNMIGQAKFLRAFSYYLLVSRFGGTDGIPLKLNLTTDMGTNFNIPRTPTKDVYEYIIKDMTDAEALVPAINAPQVWQSASPTTTVVSKSAIEAVLARVCLAAAGNPLKDRSKYQLALDWAKKVIQSGLHSLNSTPLNAYPNTPAYARLFINNIQNNINDPNVTEGIWDAAFISKSNTSGAYANTGAIVNQQLGVIMGLYCPDATPASVYGFSPGTYRVHNRFYKLFAPGDQRRDWAIAPYLYKTNGASPKYFYLSVNITGGNGSGAAATAYVNQAGTITSIVIDNPGSGYTTPPTITFTGYSTNNSTTTSGTGATATAVVSGGKITAINIISGGTGYPSAYERCIGKWRREYETNLPPVRNQTFTSTNFPIVRYADVLLMAAEADLQVNGSPSAEAVGYYNQVRRRAFGFPPLSANGSIDASTFTIQDIMDERSRELCFEGVRRMDLIRWGFITTAMQNVLNDVNTNAPSNYVVAATNPAINFLSNPAKYSLFPIPNANELAQNTALTQNPGW